MISRSSRSVGDGNFEPLIGAISFRVRQSGDAKRYAWPLCRASSSSLVLSRGKGRKTHRDIGPRKRECAATPKRSEGDQWIQAGVVLQGARRLRKLPTAKDGQAPAKYPESIATRQRGQRSR